ncbi:MAG: hypothetical protein RMI01_09290 [Thermodesulfovibrio sp.]|nr:hypothetical protein [Thermodesulfovibrio sp.]
MIESITEKRFDGLILTQVVDCYYKYEYNKQKEQTYGTPIIKGSLVDMILKASFSDINKTYSKEITYKGLTFYAKPDFIIDETIYELKVFDRLYISDRVLKQCWGYHKFYELPIKLVIIVGSNIHVIDPFEEEETKERAELLFEESVDLFSKQEPNFNECYTCPFKNICPHYKDPFADLKFEYNANSVYKLKHNIKDNSIIITPNNRKYFVKEIKEEPTKEIKERSDEYDSNII